MLGKIAEKWQKKVSQKTIKRIIKAAKMGIESEEKGEAIPDFYEKKVVRRIKKTRRKRRNRNQICR